MAESGWRAKLAPSRKSLERCMVSCFFVFLTQLALAAVPHFFLSLSLFSQLCLSAAVLLVIIGIGGRCRRLIGISASAPAFVVVSILYTWGVYTILVKRAVSRFMDVLFNGDVFLLMIGLRSIFTRDPGLAAEGASPSSEQPERHTESYALVGRVRFCRICKAYIKGLDHHCPAFGNCIGQNNHRLFMALLVGFLVTEATFVACSYQFLAESQAKVIYQAKLDKFQSTIAVDLAGASMLFSLLQLLWQAPFFAWHVYCVCSNIKTEEWINWKKYRDLHVIVEAEQVHEHPRMQFRNPYDKGFLQNVKEFFKNHG